MDFQNIAPSPGAPRRTRSRNGTLDLQVPYRENLDGIARNLKEGGNTVVEVVAEPRLNHLLQTAGTGLPGEYGEITETVAPAVLERVAKWIVARFGSR